MLPSPPFPDEAGRLKALEKYGIMYTERDEGLDELAAMAAQICGTPIALVTLVDGKTQWYKAKVGLDGEGTARDISFCAHALNRRDPLIIPDATKDPRFADNPSVTGSPGIRFYAGAPLITPENAVLGTLCVIDRVPRKINALQEQVLRMLSRQVVTYLELRRRTAELSALQEKLNAVAGHARVGLVMVDRNRRYNYANRHYAEIFGLTPEQVLGRRVQEVLGDLYETQVRVHADRAFDGEPVEYEFRQPLPQGDRFFAVRYEPIRVKGEVARAVVVLTDVTAHKKAAEEARLGHERLRLVSRATNDAVWDWNIETNLLWWNDAYWTLFGYTPEETGPTLESWVKHIHPEDRDRVWNGLQEKIGSGSNAWSDEYRYRRGDQSYASIFDRGYVLRDKQGKAVRMIGAMQDITERKRSEEKIAEQAALLDETRDAILVRELDGKILFWSRGAERTYGWMREEIVGRKIGLIFDEDESRLQEINQSLLRSGAWAGEVRHISRDARHLIMEVRSTLLRDRDGTPKSVIAINTDITERKKLEEQLLRAQRMEGIGTLAGGIAHDLNNALGPILLSIELLRNRFRDPSSQELLKVIAGSAQRGADMVRQVLSFARGYEGERIGVQVRHLVREMEKMARETFPGNIHVTSEVAPDLAEVSGDPTQLHQVLLNLCVNARDAMPNGGELILSAENTEVDAHYAGLNPGMQAGPYVLMRVEDTGTGIPPEIVTQIFDPFFTTKEVGKGTGLGLSTSLAIVKSHGGFLHVYSEPGRGTTFKVYLPARAETSTEVIAREESDGMPRGHGELVLVIDDEHFVREITRQTLEEYGYKVLLAESGAEAAILFADHLEKNPVVITDMRMPVMDGAATIQVLRRLKPDVRIIAVSGLSVNGRVAQAASLGVSHFLPKPYTARSLLEMLRKVIAGANDEAEPGGEREISPPPSA